MGRRCLAKLATATLASVVLACLSSCGTGPLLGAPVVAMNDPESLDCGLDTYVLLPRDASNDSPQVARNYQALLSQVTSGDTRPSSATPREINRIHVPVHGFDPNKPIDLKSVDHMSSRIYLDAIACLLPLYTQVRERVLLSPGPFLVTSSPGLNTLAARNRIMTGRYSVEEVQDSRTQLGMDWMLIVDLSQASPQEVQATMKAYQQRLDLRDYYKIYRKLSSLENETRRMAPGLENNVLMVIVQPLAFMPGMMPGQGCSPYIDVLVDSGAVGYFRRAEFLAQSGYHELALWDLNRTIALEPEFSGAYHARGLRQLDLGHVDAALSDFNRAIQLDPSTPALFRGRATAHFKKGHYREAIDDIGVYIASHPEQAESYCNRALAHAHLGAFEQSQQDLEQCRRLAGEVDAAYVEAIKRLRQASGQP